MLDVLDAEQELLDARVSHVKAQQEHLVATFELKASVGQLTGRDLGFAAEVYDYQVHYNEVRGKWFGTRSSGDVE